MFADPATKSGTDCGGQQSLGRGGQPGPNDPRMYVANTGSDTVSVINTATGQRIDAKPALFLDGYCRGFLAQRAGGKRRW